MTAKVAVPVATVRFAPSVTVHPTWNTVLPGLMTPASARNVPVPAVRRKRTCISMVAQR